MIILIELQGTTNLRFLEDTIPTQAPKTIQGFTQVPSVCAAVANTGKKNPFTTVGRFSTGWGVPLVPIALARKG